MTSSVLTRSLGDAGLASVIQWTDHLNWSSGSECSRKRPQFPLQLGSTFPTRRPTPAAVDPWKQRSEPLHPWFCLKVTAPIYRVIYPHKRTWRHPPSVPFAKHPNIDPGIWPGIYLGDLCQLFISTFSYLSSLPFFIQSQSARPLMDSKRGVFRVRGR